MTVFPRRRGRDGKAPAMLLACARARAADTNPGSGDPRGAPASRPPRGSGRGGRSAPAADGGAVRASRGAALGHVADAASPHGRPALSSFASLALARRRGVRLPIAGRVRRAGRAQAEARRSVRAAAPQATRRQQVRVTFARPAGRSGSRPWRRASATASSCPATTKLIGTSVSESGARSTTAPLTRSAMRSSLVIA